jgi:methyl-accepting chemotaxis protein
MTVFWDACTIKSKLLIGIGGILAIFAISSAIVLFFVNSLAASADRALLHNLPMRALAFGVEYELSSIDNDAAHYIMARDPQSAASFLGAFTADVAKINNDLPNLRGGIPTQHELDTVTALTTWFATYQESSERAIALKRAGNQDRALQLFVRLPTRTGHDLITDFVASKSARAAEATAEVQSSSNIAVVASIVGALAAIVTGGIIAMLLGGSIAKRLGAVTDAIETVVRVDFAALRATMTRFGAGNLTAPDLLMREALVVHGKDETAMLTKSYNNLLEGIKEFGREFASTGATIEALISGVKTGVDAASKGNFSQRLETASQRGSYKELGDNVNELMAVCNAGLSEIVRVLGALAQGDLTETITNEYEGMFGRLKDDSNQTVSSLTRTVSAIKESAHVVSTSARQIAAGNNDLSQRTEEQAASLEETAASMEQLTATVQQNSDNARLANDLAIGASKVAVKGGQVVGEVVQTMSAINDSGRKIVDIISVIDGIAFQTNILALNAAVEAARAGEQGRGFAVVAGEVRTLAQRTAGAAKEVKQLIGDSVEKTLAGTQLVSRAGETMDEIVNAVKSVTDIMSAIASASLQQGSGIGQVNEAVAQMDKVTQQNAALVEEIAASAKALEDHARGLVESVGVFTLADTFVAPTPPPRPARPEHVAVAATRRTRPVAPRTTARRPPSDPVATLIEHDEPGDWKSF